MHISTLLSNTAYLKIIIKKSILRNLKKIYDKNKVSKIVGNDIFYTGLGIILIAIISIFLNNKYYYAMMITQTITLLIGLLLSCYHFFWTCKK